MDEIKKNNKKKREYKRNLPFLLIAEKLDNNEKVRGEFFALHKRGNVSIDDMMPLRKKLEPTLTRMGLAPLSVFWDDFLLLAVSNYPNLKLSGLKVGTSITKCIQHERTGEPLWIIEVYPETNRFDIDSAYRRIRNATGKKKIQPIAKKYHKLKTSSSSKKTLKKRLKQLPEDSEYKRLIEKAIK